MKTHYWKLVFFDTRDLPKLSTVSSSFFFSPDCGEKREENQDYTTIAYALCLLQYQQQHVNQVFTNITVLKRTPLPPFPPKHIIWASGWSFRTEKAENKVAREGREAEEFSAKMQLFLLSYQVSRVHIQEVSFLTLAAP